jgi:hypothetical protein
MPIIGDCRNVTTGITGHATPGTTDCADPYFKSCKIRMGAPQHFSFVNMFQ